MIRLLQWYFRYLSKLLPGYSGRFAAKLFLTPGRYPIQSDAGRELMNTAEQETLDTIAGPMAVRRWPNDGPRVLLIHGWSDRGPNLGDLIRHLLDEGYDVTAPDLPGHGDSAGKRTSMREWMTALRQLSVRAGEWHAVIGHSLGGFAAAASTRTDLPQYGPSVKAERLVLIAPPDRSGAMLDLFGNVLRIPSSVRFRAANELSRIVQADFEDFSTAEAVANFPGEALVFHDREDQRVPFSHFENIRRLAPDRQFVVTEGLGHRRILSDTRVLEQIGEFLDESTDVSGTSSVAVAGR